MVRILAILCATAACSSSDAKTADDVTVTLSSVNLGDDCWTPPAPPAPPAPAKVAPPSVVAPSTPPANRKASPPGVVASCDQTSMQLLVTTAASFAASPVKVKKVELLDGKGKLVQELTARDAQRWDTDKYVAWDQRVAGGAKLQVMYPLTAPDWSKVGGRMTAHEKTFQLRVTVTVGAGSHTVEKQSIVPARLPPPVPT